MKKILIITAALFSISTAAATSYQPSASECSTVSVRTTGKEVSAYFRKDTSFPEVPRIITLNTGDKLNCQNIYIAITSNVFYLKGDIVRDTLNSYGAVNITFSERYKDPILKTGRDYSSNSINYDLDMVNEYSYILGREILEVSPFNANYVAGYRVNGGPIAPLIYDGFIYPIPNKDSISIIEIFSKPHPNNTWQKIVIDRKNKTLELHRNFEFPK